jgi:hypothetical protein
VSEYLHATYDESGLNIEFDPPVFFCPNAGFISLEIFHAVIGEVSRAISALLPTSRAGLAPFDNGGFSRKAK